MWNLKILDCDLYYNFYLFLIFSFIGWIYESTLVSIQKKTFVNRGFLNGPIIPIYGCGVVAVYLSLHKYADNLVVVFFAGMIITTFLEYLTSYVMEKLFHAKWWDYSSHKFNFQGRIYLGASLLWGVMSVAMIKILQPLADKLIMFIPRKQGEIVGDLFLLMILADITVTCIHTVNLDHMLNRMSVLRDEILDYIEQSKMKDTREEWKIKLADSKSGQRISELFELLHENVERFKEKSQIKNHDIEFIKLKDLEKRIKEYEDRYQSFLANRVHRRLIKAFPSMNLGRRSQVFAELKEKIKKRKE